ncbi:MAG: TonB-dependent receptor, partial [Bacteroidales bacterium]|nr:TonB-dependent receptor [Bacteroidales bacterium]
MWKWLGIIIFACAVFPIQAQPPRGGERDFSNMPKEGIIKGKILEEGTNLPMEYANFVLYSFRDSSMVAGTVCNPDGTFELKEVRFGRFYAIANFIGYNKKIIHDIKITPKQKEIVLQDIFLENASTRLEGVEIVADRAHVEYKIDKKIVNVSQDILAQGSSAVEVLENTPSVQVDIEGNVSLRGTSNFTVLIDGRPSVLTGSEALQQIPASTIDNIEIITNPSAKYDPDGVGGIINVVLKKQKQPGMNGVINTSIGTGNKYKVDALLNYKTKNLNIFGGIDYNYRQFSMEGHTEYESLYNDTASFRNSDMNGKMNRNGYGIKTGIDYYLSDNSTLTLSGKYGTYGFGREFTSTNTNWTSPLTSYEYLLSESQSEHAGDYYNLNLNYITKFNQPGHQIEFLGYYSKSKGDDWDEQNDFESDANWNKIGEDPELIKTTEDNFETEIRIKADYTYPIGE